MIILLTSVIKLTLTSLTTNLKIISLTMITIGIQFRISNVSKTQPINVILEMLIQGIFSYLIVTMFSMTLKLILIPKQTVLWYQQPKF